MWPQVAQTWLPGAATKAFLGKSNAFLCGTGLVPGSEWAPPSILLQHWTSVLDLLLLDSPLHRRPLLQLPDSLTQEEGGPQDTIYFSG